MIEDAETQLRKAIDTAKYLQRLLQNVHSATWKAVDPDYVMAKSMYKLVRAKLVEEVNALPNV